MGDQPVIRPLPTHRTTQTLNKRRETSIPGVGFEPTISLFERAKTVHALDRASAVIGETLNIQNENMETKSRYISATEVGRPW
jgi:hypothetical protein